MASQSSSYPPGIDPCLVGTWTVTVVFQNAVYTVTVRGIRWEEGFSGTATGRYATGNGRILYSNWVVSGTWYINRNGRRSSGGQLSLSVEPDNYVCNGDSLTFATNQNSQQLTRVKD